MQFSISFGLFVFLFSYVNVQGQTPEDAPRMCIFTDPPAQYSEGDQFIQTVDEICSFVCTCMIEDDGIGRGECNKRRCAPMDVPAGCKPELGTCGCVSSYDCTPEEVCEDPSTGIKHKKGDSISNDTCDCVCVGKSVGFQCECATTTPPPPPPSVATTTETCIPNENVTCTNITSDAHDCGTYQKCQQWSQSIMFPQLFQTFTRTCTCIGDDLFECSRYVPSMLRRKRFAGLRKKTIF